MKYFGCNKEFDHRMDALTSCYGLGGGAARLGGWLFRYAIDCWTSVQLTKVFYTHYRGDTNSDEVMKEFMATFSKIKLRVITDNYVEEVDKAYPPNQ